MSADAADTSVRATGALATGTKSVGMSADAADTSVRATGALAAGTKSAGMSADAADTSVRATGALAAGTKSVGMSADAGRGRDSGYQLPPAQPRAGASHAHGSCLGCLASKRSAGYGCRISTAGSKLPSRSMNRFHVQRVR